MRILLFLFLLLVPLFTTAQSKSAISKIDYKRTGAPLPPFRIENEKGILVNNSVLKLGKPVIVMIFSPECDHCLHLMDSLQNMGTRFSKYQTILVTEAIHKDEFKTWRNGKGMNVSPIFPYSGWERSNLIYFLYTYKMLPQINIYNSKQQLLHTFAGQFPLDSLRMYLK